VALGVNGSGMALPAGDVTGCGGCPQVGAAAADAEVSLERALELVGRTG
jgi:hypothetical protein